jgi:hypothetical protein
VIKIGAATETAMKEKNSRIQDAMHATRAAIQEGILPGGGVGLLRARSGIGSLKGINPASSTLGGSFSVRRIHTPDPYRPDDSEKVYIKLLSCEPSFQAMLPNAGNEVTVGIPS